MPRIAAICLLLLVACAPDAAAEWHFTPMAGLTMFGSTSILDPEEGTGKVHLNAGGAVSWLSRGIFGVEALTTWTPNFFEGDPRSDLLDPGAGPVEIDRSRAFSLMANVLVTLPQRWTEYGLRPFVSGGFGWMHAQSVDESEIFPVKVNVRGVNIGGGAVGFLTQNTGVRFDVRYHSTLNQLEAASAFGDAHLRYVTASVGLVFRR
jgi:hypothetical protein